MCAPGNAEEGVFRTNQVDLWVRGTTHPAPLSRAKIEALGATRTKKLTAIAYNGPVSSSPQTVGAAPREARFMPALPPVAAEAKTDAKPMPGRKPDDPTLEAAFRVILRQGTSPEEVDAKLAECRDYVKGNAGLTEQLRNAALLGEFLIEESAAGRLRVPYGSPQVLEKLKALLKEQGNLKLGGNVVGQAGQAGGPSFPGVAVHRDIAYGKTHPEIQRLDAFLLKSDKPAPVAIEIHGGGWRRGSKSQFVYQGDLVGAILAAGISVVSIDYRLTPQHPMPAQMEDVVRAAQFVRSKAREWNLDPDRIAAFGSSAGAHLTAWVGLHDDVARPQSEDPIERCSSRLRCFVALSGPMDLTRVRPTELARQPLRGQDFANAFTAAFGCTAEQYEQDPAVRQRVRDASPVFLATRDDPPAFVLATWSEDLAVLRDPPVPAVINDPHSAWHGVLLAEALVKAGGTVVRRIGPETGKEPPADVAAMVSFLREKLLPTSPSP
jgi:acetyl esterase/lipase